MFVSRLISAEFDPTAASALSPANRPTTTISAALNSSCRMLEHISGNAKRSILPNTEPLHMSISYFLFIYRSSLFFMTGFLSVITTSGITITNQITGSVHMIPQYPNMPTNTNVNTSFPTSSIKLDTIGVL